MALTRVSGKQIKNTTVEDEDIVGMAGSKLSGSVSTSLLDTGTTTGKLILVDTDNKFPALDGSQITNLSAAPFTETIVTPVSNGQTNFAISYQVGKVLVFLNGVKMLNGTDFTAVNGTNIYMTNGVQTTDRLEFCVH